jgi:hypothetical protein
MHINEGAKKLTLNQRKGFKMAIVTIQFALMGKEELRAACRAAGISYNKLNNDGMRAALIAAEIADAAENESFTPCGQVLPREKLRGTSPPSVVVDEKALLKEGMRENTEADAEDEADSAVSANVFGSMFGAPVRPAAECGQLRKVVDGKVSSGETKTVKVVTPRAPVAAKVPAPVLAKVIRKGYKIQKDREERNGVKKPSEGGLCYAVWDKLDKSLNVKASDLQAIADANGWNRTNVLCEFYNWRRFNGITGRSAK